MRLRLITLSFAVLLSGCESLGKGLGEALFDHPKKEDTRVCQIKSHGFYGVNHSLNTHARVKMLVVHGVGMHIPGYAAILRDNLAQQLHLTVQAADYKEIRLADEADPKRDLGNLRVERLLSKDRKREFLLYELTWSDISTPEKKVLNYDISGEYASHRDNVNNVLKHYTNDAISDPIIYLGKQHEAIEKSFAQSYCWMISHNWQDFPNGGQQVCNLFVPEAYQNIKQDEYLFLSHSLGSRITIDGIERIAKRIDDPKIEKRFPDIKKIKKQLQKHEIKIFMLSNQLPLLQVGHPLPDVTESRQKYCSAKSAKYGDRFANKTHIIALSDPNDLLSYGIPVGFKEKYLDSRLCTQISNGSIHIADTIDLLGLGQIANPVEAHLGYYKDERTIAMIAYGVGTKETAPIVQERCEWTETIP